MSPLLKAKELGNVRLGAKVRKYAVSLAHSSAESRKASASALLIGLAAVHEQNREKVLARAEGRLV